MTQSSTLHPNIPLQLIQNLITTTLYSPPDQTLLTFLPKTTTLNNQSTKTVMYTLTEPSTVLKTFYFILFNIDYVNNPHISTCLLFLPQLFACTVRNAKRVNLRHNNNLAHSIFRGTTTSKQAPFPTLLNSCYSSPHSPHHYTPPLNSNSNRDYMSSQITVVDNYNLSLSTYPFVRC